jgi:hypothetical protein
VNRTRLLLLGSVALSLGTFVCSVVYKNLQTRSGANNKTLIDVVLASKLAAENARAGIPHYLIPSGLRAVSVRVDKLVAVADFVFPGCQSLEAVQQTAAVILGGIALTSAPDHVLVRA